MVCAASTRLQSVFKQTRNAAEKPFPSSIGNTERGHLQSNVILKRVVCVSARRQFPKRSRVGRPVHPVRACVQPTFFFTAPTASCRQVYLHYWVLLQSYLIRVYMYVYIFRRSSLYTYTCAYYSFIIYFLLLT